MFGKIDTTDSRGFSQAREKTFFSRFGRRFLILLTSVLPLWGACISFAYADPASVNSIKLLKTGKESGEYDPNIVGSATKPNALDAYIEVNYSYDGSEGPAYIGARVTPRLTPSMQGGFVSERGNFYSAPITTEKNGTITLPIAKPDALGQTRTDEIDVFIYANGRDKIHDKFLAEKDLYWKILWPETDPSSQRKIQTSDAYRRQLLSDAIRIIDDEDSSGESALDVARGYLDRILNDDPKCVPAYLELARIALKPSQGSNEEAVPKGLGEAQRLIRIALKIDPNNAKAYLLSGLALMYQDRMKEATVEFDKAEKIGTDDLWLYVDYGYALEKLKQVDKAIAKYQQGVALTPRPDTDEFHSGNRAIPSLFSALHRLLGERNDLVALDALYKKGTQALPGPCEKTHYAYFKLFEMGDYDAAIKWAAEAEAQNCHAGARQVLGEGYLAKWALDSSRMAPSEREALLTKSQTLISSSQELALDFASSALAEKMLPKLAGAGFPLDEADESGATPVAYAASRGNADALKQLIRAGAKPDDILKGGWTPIMIAVAAGHAEAVKVLLDEKADIERKAENGQSAVSLARASNNKKIIKLLDEAKKY